MNSWSVGLRWRSPLRVSSAARSSRAPRHRSAGCWPPATHASAAFSRSRRSRSASASRCSQPASRSQERNSASWATSTVRVLGSPPDTSRRADTNRSRTGWIDVGELVPSSDLSNPAVVVGEADHGQEGAAELVLLLRCEVLGLDERRRRPGRALRAGRRARGTPSTSSRPSAPNWSYISRSVNASNGRASSVSVSASIACTSPGRSSSPASVGRSLDHLA